MADINQRIYSDIDLNFTRNLITGDINILQGDLPLIRSVEGLVLTNFYERLFNPDIGGNVTRLLFELVTNHTAMALTREIVNVITNFEPRITNLTVNVSPSIQKNGYNVYVTFYINNSTSPVEIVHFLERLG